MLKNELSKPDSSKLLIWGISLILVYKIYKLVLKKYFGLDPFADYQTYQNLLTCYRAIATFVAGYLIKNYYLKDKNLLRLDSDIFFKVFFGIFLIFYAVSRVYILKISFIPSHFLQELPHNFFTGTWEDFVFKGMILFGLMGLIKKEIALLVSSILFSLWHWDVVFNGFWEYYFLFIMGLISGISFLLKCSLFELAIYHFLWDQIFFGFKPTVYSPISFKISNFVTYAGVSIALIILLSKYVTENKKELHQKESK